MARQAWDEDVEVMAIDRQDTNLHRGGGVSHSGTGPSHLERNAGSAWNETLKPRSLGLARQKMDGWWGKGTRPAICRDESAVYDRQPPLKTLSSICITLEVWEMMRKKHPNSCIWLWTAEDNQIVPRMSLSSHEKWRMAFLLHSNSLSLHHAISFLTDWITRRKSQIYLLGSSRHYSE